MVERSISPADPIALANPSVLGQLRSVEIQARKKLAKLKTATLDQHLDDTLRRVRAEFEHANGVEG
jgi:hypothetical protein